MPTPFLRNSVHPDNAPAAGSRREFHGRSWQLLAIDITLRMTIKPLIRFWAATSDLPWPAASVDHLGRFLRPIDGVEESRIDLPECSATIYAPATVATDRW